MGSTLIEKYDYRLQSFLSWTRSCRSELRNQSHNLSQSGIDFNQWYLVQTFHSWALACSRYASSLIIASLHFHRIRYQNSIWLNKFGIIFTATYMWQTISHERRLVSTTPHGFKMGAVFHNENIDHSRVHVSEISIEAVPVNHIPVSLSYS